MNWADTRSKVAGAGSHSNRSPWHQVIRSATCGPARSAISADVASATEEMSTPVTTQPCEASQIASAPSPQPTSSAVPGLSSVAYRTSTGLGNAASVRSRLAAVTVEGLGRHGLNAATAAA